MTSRSSSWVNLIENNKRRIWQWCIAILLLVVLNSVLLTLFLISIDESRYILDYGSRASDMMIRDARKYCSLFIGSSGYKIVVTTVLAALLGFGGFSYLNDKVKLDFYESVPLKRGNRFSTIWLSGIIMYAGTYIIGTLICFAAISAVGFGDAYTMEEALYDLVKMLVYFMGVYHLFILSMMLTGTTFAGVCAFLILSVYEFAIRGLIGQLTICFFKYHYILDSFYVPLVSPYGLLSKLLGTDSDFKYMAGMLALDFALLVISYVLYLKRPAERAGKTLVFKKTATVIKLLTAIPVVAFTAAIVIDILDRTRDLNSRDMAAIVCVCLITAIIVCAIIQAVFELDIRGALHKKVHWFVCALAALAIFFGFKIDFFNIDEYIPASNKVASAVFVPESYDDNYSFIDENGVNMRDYEYWLKHMYISDVDSVCALARTSMDKYDDAVKIAGNEDYWDSEAFSDFSPAVIMYRLKNGRLITRRVYVPVKDAETVELLDKILSTREFVKGYYSIMNYDIGKILNDNSQIPGMPVKTYKYTDGVHEAFLTADELKELAALYRADMEQFSYKDRLSLWPSGYVEYELVGDAVRSGGLYDYYYSSYSSDMMRIYPNMTNCIKYLKDKGYDFASIPLADEAAAIDVTNYHYDEQNDYALENGLDYLPEEMAADYVKSISLDPSSDPDKFAEAAGCLHPSGTNVYRWDRGTDADYNYEVFVYFKESSKVGKDFKNGAYYYFEEDKVPAFIEEELSL